MLQQSRKTAWLAVAVLAAACVPAQEVQTSGGPADQGPPLPQKFAGNVFVGRDVFRFETFGNERFWTDALRLPAGMAASKVTPMQALQLGLQVDIDAVEPRIRMKLAQELAADPSGNTSRILNDPTNTPKLIMANAVMGMSAKDGRVGTSCALCHSISDASVFTSPWGGSIGHRVDGPANHVLNVGKIFATAANTRALYPLAQLQLAANKGKTLGRAPRGLDGNSTEVEFDAYFSDPRYYPVGMFDDTPDGNGDPMHNAPLFRQDLAAPYGSEGTFTKLEDFNNFVFTTLLDPTMLTTAGGRAFVHKLAGPAGDEMVDTYVEILKETGVKGYPYVEATITGKPGDLATPIGARVNDDKLIAMNAYLAALPAPAGVVIDPESVERGRALFVSAGCTACHNLDQGRPVPTTVHPMATIWPGDHPMLLAERARPLNPILNTNPGVFDDKMAVVNASQRGDVRGVTMPLLLDLARKPVFLHDNSVPRLEALLDPERGPTAPHPFYLDAPQQRADLSNFLKSLDTGPRFRGRVNED